MSANISPSAWARATRELCIKFHHSTDAALDEFDRVKERAEALTCEVNAPRADLPRLQLLALDLEGVITEVDSGADFDGVSLQTLRRVRDGLLRSTPDGWKTALRVACIAHGTAWDDTDPRACVAGLVGRDAEFLRGGRMVSGPHGQAIVYKADHVEPVIAALCIATGDDASEYTATYLDIREPTP